MKFKVSYLVVMSAAVNRTIERDTPEEAEKALAAMMEREKSLKFEMGDRLFEVEDVSDTSARSYPHPHGKRVLDSEKP